MMFMDIQLKTMTCVCPQQQVNTKQSLFESASISLGAVLHPLVHAILVFSSGAAQARIFPDIKFAGQ